MSRRQSPGAERQEWYRFTHPQLNITFRDRAEHDRVQWALLRQHQTARTVLLAWAAGGGEAAAPPRLAPGSPVTSDSPPGTPVTSDTPSATAAPVPPGEGPRARAVGPA